MTARASVLAGIRSFSGVRAAIRGLGTEGRQLLLLLVATGAILLPHLDHVPLWASAATCALFGYKLWMLIGRHSQPGRWLLIAISTSSIAATVIQFGTILGREAGVTMLVMLMCIKLLELRAQRDTMVVIFLGFFLALCQFLFSQSIATALCVLAAVAALLTALISQHLEGDPAIDGPASFRVAFSITLRMMVYAAPMVIAAFVLFPRISGPLWGAPDNTRSGMGLSETMTPGSITDLVESNSIAFRARFDGAVPPSSQLYWRALVLGNYDGRTWRELRGRAPRRLQQQFAKAVEGSEVLRYTLTQEPIGRPWIYVLDLPTDYPSLLAGDANRGVQLTGPMTFSAEGALRDRVQIRGESILGSSLAPPESVLSLQDWLDLPPGLNPRTMDLAAAIQGKSDDPAQHVADVLAMFHLQPFRYTLKPPSLGKHAIDEFLFDSRAGFCEHYAAAFVVLMRAVGVPARVVTGYQGGEVNSVDGWLEVRQRDAHAWTEVWLGPPRGWVRVDPTAAVAPERVERGFSRALPDAAGFGLGGLNFNGANPLVKLAHWMRDRVDAVENKWNLWVLQYNTDTQIKLLKRIGLEEPNWRNLILIMMGALAVGSSIVSVVLLWRREPREPALVVLDRFDRKLAGAGLGKRTGEGPLAWQTRLRRELSPGAAAHAGRILEAWIQLRYRQHRAGPTVNTSPDLAELNRWIKRFHV
jgi:transglutaminase-like putative cysteine protease